MFGHYIYYGNIANGFSYLLYILPALLLAMWAQARVKSTFRRFSTVMSTRGLTGEQAARTILDRNGLYNVHVERIQGTLNDHYDPVKNIICLSDPVFTSTSVASIGVAAHEAGHAVQHAVGYAPMKLRSTIIPVTKYGSSLSMPLIFVGFLLNSTSLILAGIVLFSLVVLFQLVTLPVEFDASARALHILDESGMLYGDELTGAKKVLRAAALTYVAALLVSLMSLLRYVMIFTGMRRRN